MSAVQNKIIKELESKIMKLNMELAEANEKMDKLQKKFSTYIANVRISQERWK